MRILAFSINKMLAFGNFAHLVFLVMSNWKQSLLKLPVVYLSQEIGLILYRVRTCNEPFATIVVHFSLCIMARGYKVVVVSTLFVEGTKLD